MHVLSLYHRDDISLIEIATVVFEIWSLATSQKMCVGGGEPHLKVTLGMMWMLSDSSAITRNGQLCLHS